MKQLVILSGKGGTGKTSIAAAFAHLAHDGPSPLTAVLADADVDAANLELVLQPQRLETHDFMGGDVAIIDPSRCHGCGICSVTCRFDAIIPPSTVGNNAGSNGQYVVDQVACEGCAACMYQCPEKAIYMQPQLAGQWYRSDSRYGSMFHADLRPAQENSGKLVTMVKQQARRQALDCNIQIMIVDGPPGIGCPVISTISGADLVLVVAEPTVAGVHDMQRILETASHFRIPALVCINKADIFPEGTTRIEKYCQENDIEMVGKVPFDEVVTRAMMNGEPVTLYDPHTPASREIATIWENVVRSIAV